MSECKTETPFEDLWACCARPGRNISENLSTFQMQCSADLLIHSVAVCAEVGWWPRAWSLGLATVVKVLPLARDIQGAEAPGWLIGWNNGCRIVSLVFKFAVYLALGALFGRSQQIRYLELSSSCGLAIGAADFLGSYL